MSTIDIRKATKKFRTFVAVRDVDLSVAAGEVVACSALRAAARRRRWLLPVSSVRRRIS
jgi:hypothetical protein